jgi:acetyltransferase-like isoleucine patch superfamily enzyme
MRVRDLVSPASLRWAVRNRALRPYDLVRYWRFALLKLRHPEVVTEGMVYLGRGVEVTVRKGYGRIVLGPWVHVGDGTRLRAHEGTLRIGAKTVLGRAVTLNCYLDVSIGAACMVADEVYVADFDHRTDGLDRPMKDQGIVKAPVAVGDDVWLGLRSSVLRGSRIGAGSVVGAHAVVRGELPPLSVAVGVPARVVRQRDDPRPPPGPARTR